MSGGSGQRLWPISNGVRSKQFIKLFKNEQGEYESMVQRVWRQIHKTDPEARVTVATSRAQVSALHNQLGDGVSLSIEPCRRDTFPAIALAGMYLRDVQGVPEAEPVVVCPVDPYVGDDYFAALHRLAERAESGPANLVLMGIRPTYPSEKYGYIIPESDAEVSAVRTFKEKPDAAAAARYIAEDGLWNGGIFACRLGYLVRKAHELVDFADYQDLYAKYATLPRISFDYAVAEKEPKLEVVRFAGEWKDVGSWNTLTETMAEPSVGNVLTDAACDNVHIINELGIPVLAMGLKDAVVAAGPGGVLVADKEQSSYIRPYVERIDQTVRFAEKSWGSFLVLDVGENSMVIKVTLNKGHRMNYHSHKHRDEVWVVVAGEGRTLVDGMEQPVRAGDVVAMQAGCRHTVIADSRLELIEVQMGKEIDVHDKRKFPLE